MLILGYTLHRPSIQIGTRVWTWFNVLGNLSKASFFLLGSVWEGRAEHCSVRGGNVQVFFYLCECMERDEELFSIYCGNVWVVGSFVWPRRAEELCSVYELRWRKGLSS